MTDWIKINKNSILNDRVLLLKFSNDYERAFNQPLNVGCKLCINDAYNRLTSLNKNKMAKKKNECEYLLNYNYSGMIWKSQPVRRNEMTEELAKDLIKNHKLGVRLFEFIPKEEKKIKKVVKKKEVGNKKD